MLLEEGKHAVNWADQQPNMENMEKKKKLRSKYRGDYDAQGR